MANKVKGANVEIKPFRADSRFKSIGTLTVKLEEIDRDGNYMWFVCPLNETKKLGDIEFDYVKIRPKSVDDHFNPNKHVLSHVLIGHSKSTEEPKFIDWGLIKIVK